jgi:soluble lytic murein transglycosylase
LSFRPAGAYLIAAAAMVPLALTALVAPSAVAGTAERITVAAREADAEPEKKNATAIQAVKLAIDGKHGKARALRPQIKSPAALKLLDWFSARSSKSGASFDDISKFMAQNGEWPRMNVIQARAEATLYAKPEKPERVLKHFETFPAQTGFGLIAQARALLQSGKPERAGALIRTAWREHDFSATSEKNIRKEFKKQLTGEDHRARLVRLMYSRKTAAAERTASFISSAHVKMAKAATSLFKRHRRALKRYRAVPAKLRNQLVMQYALARYYRRKGKIDEARAIAAKISESPDGLSYPGPWWEERWSLIRSSLVKDKPKLWPTAYKMAMTHGFEEGTSFVQGEFMAGWIALQFLKKPKVADGHFKAILERDKKPLNISQANYWLGRTYQALGNEETARKHFEAAAELSTTFYGQLALDALGRGAAPIPIVNGPEISEDAKAAFAKNDQVSAIRLLAAANAKRLLPTFFSALAYQLEDPQERAQLAALAVELDELWLSVRVAKVSARRGARLEQFAYPKDALPDAKGSKVDIERALVYAVSRQESEFNPRARSHAGALGLMQMMPGTARQVTKKLGLKYRKAALLDQPSYNVTLGTAFLGDLLKRFNGSYISTIAGYNAGPGRISQWNKRYGNPLKGEVEPVDWIESIPFNETRNYVKRVLENVQVYRTLFGVEPLVSLSADLLRGSEKQVQAASEDCPPASESTIEHLIACN